MRRETVKHFSALTNFLSLFPSGRTYFLASAIGFRLGCVRGGADGADGARWSQQGVNQLEEHATHATGGLTRQGVLKEDEGWRSQLRSWTWTLQPFHSLKVSLGVYNSPSPLVS